MSIVIDETARAIWHVDLMIGNWIGVLSNTDGKLEVRYRFRWFRDTLIGPESKDIRNFYTATFTGSSEDEAIKSARELFEALLERSPERKGWELIRGARSYEEFFDDFMKMPSIHT